jgi:hypothetical protein
MRAETIREEHGSGEKSRARTETRPDDGTRPGAENRARRHADCRALERVPERKTGDEPGRREPIEEPAALVSRRRTGPMRKSQHRRRGSPSRADPRMAQKLSQRRRAVRERQRLGRSACGEEMSEREKKRKKRPFGHTENRGSDAESNFTDGDAASGEDESREPRRTSGEHTRRTGGANEKTNKKTGDAFLLGKARHE